MEELLIGMFYELLRLAVIAFIVGLLLSRELGHRVAQGAETISSNFIKAFQDSIKSEILPMMKEHLSSATSAVKDGMEQISQNVKMATESKDLESLETGAKTLVEEEIARTLEPGKKEQLNLLMDQLKLDAGNKQFTACEKNLKKFIELATEDESVELLLEIVAIYMKHGEAQRALFLLETYEDRFQT